MRSAALQQLFRNFNFRKIRKVAVHIQASGISVENSFGGPASHAYLCPLQYRHLISNKSEKHVFGSHGFNGLTGVFAYHFQGTELDEVLVELLDQLIVTAYHISECMTRIRWLSDEHMDYFVHSIDLQPMPV